MDLKDPEVKLRITALFLKEKKHPIMFLEKSILSFRHLENECCLLDSSGYIF